MALAEALHQQQRRAASQVWRRGDLEACLVTCSRHMPHTHVPLSSPPPLSTPALDP